ncbi:MAG: DUF2442 domain-containing protein [Cyanobacteria bacterium P01_H01_bin.21]
MVEANLDLQIAQARQTAALAAVTEPRAVSAHYDTNSGLIVILLKSGAVYSFPSTIAQGLTNADAKLLAEVEITPAGDGLHWETLDVDFTVKGLLAGIFGTKAWMTELQKRWE